MRAYLPLVLALAALSLACSSSSTNTTGGDPCAVGCDKAVALNCGKDTSASCLAECQSVVTDANKVGCGAEARAYLDCIVALPFFCGTSGRAQVDKSRCEAQSIALDRCESADAPAPSIDSGADG